MVCYFVCILISQYLRPYRQHKINTVTEGGSMTLPCYASGIPPPMVSWMKVGGYKRIDGNELVFIHINRSEAGEYRCDASNQCGNASETATIEVQCKQLNITWVLLLLFCYLVNIKPNNVLL